MRRQATLTVWSVLLCGIDLLLAPVFLLAVAFAGDAPRPTAAMQAVIMALIASAIASVACPLAAFVAGLAGAPRRLVLGLALLPVLALAGFIAALFLFGS